ncbi:hydroxymethylglutaryl-CoA lyase [Candidatus Fermentibacteria bacterium]|nr:hydroxymethylglutaryl-CoA lyase [Candidatus Fermentibacteria bacterium]
MPEIVIHEVGMRDGLQMESGTVPFETKVSWIEKLIKAGIDIIQIGSFVHPVKVPQMADTDRLFSYFASPGRKPASVVLSGLVLNEKGLERGEACGVEMYCMGVSASETHSMKNTGMSSAEATDRIIAMAQKAVAAGKKVQVSVQSAFGCGFEGPIPPERVLNIVQRYLAAGLRTISLADTAGHANPDGVRSLFKKIVMFDPGVELACHFHNTYGLGLANCHVALQSGVRSLESAFGGLGGCPFTKQPSGNVCTEDLVHYLQRSGQRPDIDLADLIALAREAAVFLKRDLPGYVYKVGPLKAAAPV